MIRKQAFGEASRAGTSGAVEANRPLDCRVHLEPIPEGLPVCLMSKFSLRDIGESVDELLDL
jgi:hypothetical protein